MSISVHRARPHLLGASAASVLAALAVLASGAGGVGATRAQGWLGAAVVQAAPPETPDALFRKADAALREGRIAEAVAGFDALVAAAPELAPQLWQRGIALYYAGRFADCRTQFELHRTVNPNDVENAAWHFLCVARASSAADARKALLPAGPDRRTPMREVYGMLEGSVTPAQVLAAGGADPSGAFYAQLYVGLYFEALGEAARSRQHLTAAAAPQYAAAGGYMHRMALVHLQVRDRR